MLHLPVRLPHTCLTAGSRFLGGQNGLQTCLLRFWNKESELPFWNGVGIWPSMHFNTLLITLAITLPTL